MRLKFTSDRPFGDRPVSEIVADSPSALLEKWNRSPWWAYVEDPIEFREKLLDLYGADPEVIFDGDAAILSAVVRAAGSSRLVLEGSGALAVAR